VVYEIMLRQEGLPLTSNIEKLTDIGSRTYLVADSYLISLEETITPEMIEKLSALNPLPFKFVFRDSAFDDDIVFKDETFRKLNALIDKNTNSEKKAYTVEFI
jgi:adenine-specific DNA-methyltransferase